MPPTDRKSGHLYLCGFRGTGKTTVATRVAQALALDVIDLDDVVQRAAGKTIRELFAAEGEAGFRDRESAALRSVAAGPPAVVSLGGGTILRQSNRDQISASGRCVWLDASAEVIHRRISGDAVSADQRPSLTTLPALQEIHTLLHTRRPLYQAVADVRIDTDGRDAAEVAGEVLRWCNR